MFSLTFFSNIARQDGLSSLGGGRGILIVFESIKMAS